MWPVISRSPLILEDVEADKARLRAHVRVPDGGEEVDLSTRFLKQCSCRTYRRRLEWILGWQVDFLKQVMSFAPFDATDLQAETSRPRRGRQWAR